jgi:predicted aspartyl protease
MVAGVRNRAKLPSRIGLFGRDGLLVASVLQAALSLASARAATSIAALPGHAEAADTPIPADAEARRPDAPEASSILATPTTRDHIGRVVVPVLINGQGPFRFIVDTGANRSTISPRLVSLLGLKPATDSTVVVNGITGSAPTVFVTVESLRAGDLAIDGLKLPVVWAPVLAGADGILGAAGLSEKSLLIDFQRNRVEIGRYLGLAERAHSVRIHTLPPTHGLVTLDARVGGVHVTAILDTGAERTLGNLALRNALKKPDRRLALAQLTSVYGATEEVEVGEVGMAPSISLDPVHINNVAIVYGDFHVFKVWELKDRPALIIGMDVLGTVASLSFDFKNQNVYVTSVANGGVPFSSGGALGDSVQHR